MKAIISLLFIITLGFTAQAQEAKTTSVLKIEAKEVKATEVKKDALQEKVEVARLYKFKNSKIKSALAFSTKRSKSKVA
ncbi:hypothetical protein [Cellulophaga fucicola]|uniref:Uncharacterized protein n=1 Tax=Cellulophaga fucicola TaxID=76595 RepID=A0A1K1N5T6_9FLAO|nr:hypothetical protein [Cellulophaga fucicola]SFW30784.1 hypothetical protein SAMN05660313_01200 [Cellulophaga fucicola]